MSSFKNIDPKGKASVVIHFPRPGWHILAAILAFVPFALIAGTLLIMKTSSSYRGLIVVPIIILTGWVLIYALTHFWKYEKKVRIFRLEKQLEVMNDIETIAQYDLSDVETVMSKLDVLQGDLKYQLKLNKIDGSTIILVETEGMYEGKFFNYKAWNEFAEKIAKSIDKQFVREVWIEDYNGKLNKTDPMDLEHSRRYRFIYLIPILVLFLGALAWRVIPVARGLVLWGGVAVGINIILSTIYIISRRKETDENAGSYLILISMVLSMTIPYIMIYFFLVFMVNGFRLTNIF